MRPHGNIAMSRDSVFRSSDLHNANVHPQIVDHYVVTGGVDTILRVWELPTGTLVKALPGHRGCITCMSFTSMSNVVTGRHGRWQSLDPLLGYILSIFLSACTSMWVYSRALSSLVFLLTF